MIKRITIKNFRSIISQDIDVNWITTFVGQNDAGKSNVLRALNLFFNDETEPGERFNHQRDFHVDARAGQGKAKQIEVTLHIELPDSFKRKDRPDDVLWKRVWRESGPHRPGDLRLFSDKSEIDGRSKIPTLLDRTRFTYVPAIKDKAFFSDLQGRIYDALQQVQERELVSSAGTFEYQIGEQIKELLEALNAEFDNTVTMRMPENLRPIFETMELNGNNVPFSRRGDGIKIRHIPQMLKFVADQLDLTAKGPGVIGYNHIWGFEEPENNVEMSACFRMEKWFRSLIEKNDHHQLLLTTHSPVFYKIEDDGMDNDGNGWVTRYFLDKAVDHTNFTKVAANHADVTLGLMPLVAPYVREAKKRHDDMEKALHNAQEISDNKRPTIFVEGKTDKSIIKISWELFSNENLDAILIVDGDDDHGSANAVSSRALAWLLTMRHRDPSDRVKAFALFDNDEAGKIAKGSLKRDTDAIGLQMNGQYFKSYLLEAPVHIRPFLAAGFKIPIDLEIMFSSKIWKLARQKKWLEKADPAKFLAPRMVNDLVNEGKDPFFGLDEDDRFIITHRFTEKGKLRVVTHIENLPEEDQREALDNFIPLILTIKNALI